MKRRLLLSIILILLVINTGCTTKNITGDAISADICERGKDCDNSEDNIEIPLKELSSEVKFYTYNDNGIDIRYFAVLGSDNQPRTAFDACDVCGGYKGYEQQGDDIRCRNCGRVFSIDGIGTKNKGYGCWPSYLPHEINGDKLVIKTSDIKDSGYRFA